MSGPASRQRSTSPVLNEALQANDLAFVFNGLHSPSEMSPHLLDDATAVVIADIIRCTNTLSAIIAAGAERVFVQVKRDEDALDDVLDAHRRLCTGNPLVVGGEKHGSAIPGGAFGNSALDVPANLVGHDVTFFSTNAGRAVEAVTSLLKPGSTGAFLASMANLRELARTVEHEGFERVVFVSGGFYERLSLEDAVAGGRLIHLLNIEPVDLDDGATSMVALADRFDDDDQLIAALHRNRIGRALVQYGREADIAASITGDGIAEPIRSAMAETVGRLGWIGDIPFFTTTNQKEFT